MGFKGNLAAKGSAGCKKPIEFWFADGVFLTIATEGFS
jgi:hypothetical protein